MRVGDVLSDAPQYAGRIDDHKIAEAPWPILGRFNFDAILGRQPCVRNMAKPSFYILDEKVHHEVISVFLHVEVLQEKA